MLSINSEGKLLFRLKLSYAHNGIRVCVKYTTITVFEQTEVDYII